MVFATEYTEVQIYLLPNPQVILLPARTTYVHEVWIGYFLVSKSIFLCKVENFFFIFIESFDFYFPQATHQCYS